MSDYKNYKNDINKKCLYYDARENRCDKYQKEFEITPSGTREPNCYKCVKDLEKLLSIML